MKLSYFAWSVLLLAGTVLAGDADLGRIKTNLAKNFPEAAKGTLRPSPVPGFYELMLNAQVYYVSADGKYLVLGDLIDIATRSNLTEAARQKQAGKLLGEVADGDAIVIAPEKPRHSITVFTDVDCPYCARFHQDVPELNRLGIKVRYLMYPRAGIGSETYRRSVSVWCAADRAKAIGIAKSGGKLDAKDCRNPVERHYRLGERLGINGTPTIFLENGKKIPGYVPAAQLAAIIDQQETRREKAAAVRDTK